MASRPNYATARRREEPISTAITESPVQWLLHRRMNAQQQMRCSPRGAHLMLKVRTSVVNGTLGETMPWAERWGPPAVFGEQPDHPQVLTVSTGTGNANDGWCVYGLLVLYTSLIEDPVAPIAGFGGWRGDGARAVAVRLPQQPPISQDRARESSPSASACHIIAAGTRYHGFCRDPL